MKNTVRFISILLTTWIFFIIFSCTNNTATNKKTTITAKTTGRAKHIEKPPSTYPDTLTINLPAAVFYYPDSLQLKKIKALLDTSVYKGIMHDYFYEMRYARMAIKKNWPALTIIDSKNYRYLLFIKKDGSFEYIDLNKKNDVYGLFVFERKKSPIQVDMTNIETQISFYLKE